MHDRQVRGRFLVEDDESLSDEVSVERGLGGVPWSERDQQHPGASSGRWSHIRLGFNEKTASCYSVEIFRTLQLNVIHDGGGHTHTAHM